MKKIARHKARAFKEAAEFNEVTTSYQLRKFQSFQEETGSGNPGCDSAANAVLFENFCWWLQRCTEVHCDFKGAQSFLRITSRHFGVEKEPFGAWPVAKFRKFKKTFNDNAVLIPKVNLAFDRKTAAFLLLELAKGEKLHDDISQKAMIICLVTSLRASNVLFSSNDKDHSLTLKMSNVLEQKASEDSVACMFIYNDRQKNSKKKPVLTAVPFNASSRNPSQDCAATILKEAWVKRAKEKASPEDSVFINTRSNRPLSAAIANKRIQEVLRSYFESKDKPVEWSKFYTLKSARKAVASHMEELGCAPQTIALQLKHRSLNSQMSYICRFYKNKPGLVRALYKGL